MRQHQYLCPTCLKSFPAWYWGVSGKAGGYGEIRKPGLAKANFERHQKACRKEKMQKRVDANQGEIVRELRWHGVSVTITSDLGRGFPDIVAGYRDKNYLLEIKDGGQPASKRKLTPAEKEWHSTWRGQHAVVKNTAEALAAVGVEVVT